MTSKRHAIECESTYCAGTLSSVPHTWDLSWVKAVTPATDKAVVDTAGINDGLVVLLATRYLDNYDAAYGSGQHEAKVVLNIRTRAIPLAMSNTLWERYGLGAEYNVKDPLTKQPAVRNPFLVRSPMFPPAEGSIADLQARGAIVLVCDFAMGHLAGRLGVKLGVAADAVHVDLLAGLVPGAVAMPSGMFGLVRAQSAGCVFLGAP